MSHPMQMSLSLTGWSIDPAMLDDIAVELHHSELFGDTLSIKLKFKNGGEHLIEGYLKDSDEALKAFDALEEGIKTDWRERRDAENLGGRGQSDPQIEP